MAKRNSLLRVLGVVAALMAVTSLGATAPGAQLRSETCQSTIFAYPGDRWAGKEFACTRTSTKEQGVRGVAHRWLPCGTLVRVTNLRTGRSTRTRVIDRGPYGAKPIGGGKWRVIVAKKAPKGFKYRGCLDMTPPVARSIGHDGWDRVKVEYRTRRRPPS